MTASNTRSVSCRGAVWWLVSLGMILAAWDVVAQLPEFLQTPSYRVAPAQGQSPSYEVSGHVELLLRYGLGDPRGLVQKSYSSGLFFSQAISLDANISVPIERPISGILALVAHLDNKQPEFLQSLYMRWQAPTWQAEFGDFPMGQAGSLWASSSRLLKGFRVDWRVNDRITLGGIYSQVSGILQTRTFRGNTAEETLTYRFYPENQPFLEESYLRNLRGLEYFPLGRDYVEGFTQVMLAFSRDLRLEPLLQSYELGYLVPTIQNDPERELDPNSYAIVFTAEEYFLALRREYTSLLRDRLLEYIDDYNRTQGLTGEARREYPLSEGTDYERAFLERLSAYVALRVDSRSFYARESGRERFYALGHPQVREESVKVQIQRNEDFIDIEDPTLADYTYRVYADMGVIEFQFPREFFQNRESAVRVTYSYETGSGTYVLGLSVLQGSEKVYLNGQLLRPGIDYLIEYEVGFLVLLRDIGREDLLRIDYELARGGLGGAGDYSQNFQGLTLRYQPLEGLRIHIDLLQSHESPRPDIHPESLQTMPNTQTVLGISGQLEGESLQGNFDVGFTVNRFPSDDNLRLNLPNRVHAISSLVHGGKTVTLIGHRNGLQVYDGLSWHALGIFEGLAGLVVYDIAAAPGQLVFATSGGVSRLRLDPGDPMASFARRSNWKNFAQEDGLPSQTVYSVLIEGNRLWVGTDKGLAQAPLDGLSEEKNWTVYRKSEYPGMLSEQVLHLGAVQGWIYLGTDQGLMVFDPEMAVFEAVGDLRGVRIRDLAVDGTVVYAATDRGVRAVEGRQGLSWPVVDRAVGAIAVRSGELWYATSEGLYGLTSGLIRATPNRIITALGLSQASLWAGEEATPAYQLLLYQIDASSQMIREYPQTETLLDGRAKGRFRDIPAAEHTDYGWIGRFSINKQFGPLQLQGTLEGISPRYTPIGTLDRQDRLQLHLGAIYPISSALEIRANHREGFSDLFHSPTQVLDDSVGLRFSPASGSRIDLDYSIGRVNRDLGDQVAFDRVQRSYTLSARQQLLDDRLSLRLGYELGQTDDRLRPLYSFSQSLLSAETLYQALPGLTVRVGYRQPMNWRFGQLAGDRRVDWGANWSGALALVNLPLSLQANYQGNSRMPLAAGRTVLDQNAGLLARTSSLRLGDLVLSPQGSFSVRFNDLLGPSANTQLNGEGTLQGQFADFEGRLNYKRTFLSYPLRQLDRLQDIVRLNVSYRGFPSLRPTLDFSGSLETLLHPIFGQKTSGQYQISLELAWQAVGPLQASLLLARQVIDSEREQIVSYSLQQSLQYALWANLAPRLDVSIEYTQGQEWTGPIEELKGDIALSGSFSLVEDWAATLTAEYLFGLDSFYPNRSYSSFAITVQVGRAFVFF
jgi:hypothetical protein